VLGALALVLALVAAGVVLTRGDDGSVGLSALTLDGTVLQADGERFVMAGASAYLLPFYTSEQGGVDEALQETTERSYREREQVVAEMRRSGVNTLRIPVARSGYEEDVYGIGGKDDYLQRLRNIARVASEHDIRLVIGWWDSHSVGAQWLDTYQDVFPMMRDVREALRPWPSVVYEPFNEPHDVTWEQWEPVMEDVVRFWREDLDYSGVLLLDTINYSWSFDPDVATRMLELDAELLDGPSTVLFANHRYANDQPCFCGEELATWQEEVGRHAEDFPLVGTEYGRWTGPDFEPQDQWNAEFAAHIADEAIPGQFNGYIAFVWDWVDENTMTEDEGAQLNEYGQMVTDVVLQRYGAE
jgi:hypothetical protein